MKLIRRDFLVQALALPAITVLFARFLSACAKDPSTAVTCSKGFTATSSSNLNHTHDVTVPLADITAGATKPYTTSVGDGHTHSVTFTAADMAKLAANQAVTEATSLPDPQGHSHTFAITCTT
jgi:hypothetical protein